MAVVLLAACVLVATLLAFEGAKLAGNALLASAATLVNNVAFVALLVAMVWFFIVQRPDRPKESASSQDPRMASRCACRAPRPPAPRHHPGSPWPS